MGHPVPNFSFLGCLEVRRKDGRRVGCAGYVVGCAGYVVWVAQAMWWFNLVVRSRLSQPQAGDWAWAWLAWAELGNRKSQPKTFVRVLKPPPPCSDRVNRLIDGRRYFTVL